MSAALLVAAFAAIAVAAPVAEPEPHPLHNRTDAPFGIKKGLAYNNGGITGTLSRSGSATWAYNWGTAMNAPKFQQLPMCWGPTGDCDKNGINAKISAGDTPYVLGYNEPDELRTYGGCQQTVAQAYAAWGNDMFPFYNRGAKLVCPAVTSYETAVSTHTGQPAGLQWLWAFLKYTNNPDEFKCAAQAIHWYGAEGQDANTQAQNFITYVSHAHDVINGIYGREQPIWVTEFAPLPRGNDQLNADFLRVVLPWMDAQAWIDRYSFFMAEDLVSGSSLTQAGTVYVNGH